MADGSDLVSTEDTGYILNTGVERVVFQLLAAGQGTDALTQREIAPGRIAIKHTQPTSYVAGIEAARKVEQRARHLVVEYAHKARGEGVTWAELALVLGIEVDPELYNEPAADAFREIAHTPSRQFDRVWTGWTCASCAQRITDYGPYNGHPDDNEGGHADDCARHAAEIAAYMRRQGYDEDDLEGSNDG